MKTNISKTNKEIYIDRCSELHPNNVNTTQEIYVIAKDFEGKEYTLIFTPDDWLDTFTPTVYDMVKKQYIKYLEQKK